MRALILSLLVTASSALAAEKIAVATIEPSKAATTMPVDKHVAGSVIFRQIDNGSVQIVVSVDGFEPGSRHGFHIHEKGDLSAADLSSAGGHFNPTHHIHGGPTTSPVHAGDFGNLEADPTGHAKLELTVDDISIGTGEANDILGKAVIIHAKPDDLSSQPSGNSGARVAGGVIKLKD